MEKYGAGIMAVIVLAAFVVGYAIVSSIIKRFQELRNRPDLMEQIWREHEAKKKEKEQGKS